MHGFAHLLLALGLVAIPAAAQPEPPASLAGVRLSLDHSHTGRVGHHTYVLTPRQGQLVALFAPHALSGSPASVSVAATHLLARAFAVDVAEVAPTAVTIDGVAAQAYRLGATTYYVMPIRNTRGFVHSLVLWVDSAPLPTP